MLVQLQKKIRNSTEIIGEDKIRRELIHPEVGAKNILQYTLNSTN